MTSLTAGEIEELKELEAKATKGEWKEWGFSGVVRAVGAGYEGTHIQIMEVPMYMLRYISKEEIMANAALIAAMRNALPALLAMLQPPVAADVAEATLQKAPVGSLYWQAMQERDALRAENAALSRRVAELEALKAAKTTYRECMDCGAIFPATPEGMEAARAHSAACSGNPLLSRAEAAEAKSARLGRKLQRVGLHLCETRKKLRKVEGERDAEREKREAGE